MPASELVGVVLEKLFTLFYAKGFLIADSHHFGGERCGDIPLGILVESD